MGTIKGLLRRRDGSAGDYISGGGQNRIYSDEMLERLYRTAEIRE